MRIRREAVVDCQDARLKVIVPLRHLVHQPDQVRVSLLDDCVGRVEEGGFLWWDVALGQCGNQQVNSTVHNKVVWRWWRWWRWWLCFCGGGGCVVVAVVAVLL